MRIHYLLLMQENCKIHRYIVPIGYTLSWFFGILVGSNFLNLFGNQDISYFDNSIYWLFNGTISVYIAFLLECVFMFIDWGAVYKDERFNGKVFYLLAGLFFHVFITILVVGLLISNMTNCWVYFLVFWIVILKLGICLVSANVRSWLSEVAIRSVTSNRIK